MDNLNLLTSVAVYRYNCLDEIFNFLNELKRNLKMSDKSLIKAAPRLLIDKFLLNDNEIKYYMNHYVLCKGQLN